MMKAKKIGILAVMLVTLMFAGCGGSNNRKEMNSRDTAESVTETSDSITSSGAKASFNPVYLVKEDDISVSVTDLIYDETWGYTVEFCLENHRSESVTFTIDDSYVNDLKTIVFWDIEIAAGSKKYETVDFYVNPDEISIAKKFTFEWLIYLTESNKNNYIVRETTDFFVDENQNYTPYTYALSDTDQIVFDDDIIMLCVTNVDPEGYGGYTLNVYAENRYANPIQISIEKALINGVEVDTYGTFGIANGKKSNAQIYWMENDLEMANIDEISSIIITVSVIDEGNLDIIENIDFKVKL